MKLLKFEDKKDKLAFLVGCFATFYVSFVGRVYVGELIIFIIYLIIPKSRPKMSKEVNQLRSFMFIWLFSAIITDIWRQTPTIDMIKGVVSILFLIVLLPFVYWILFDKLSRWLYFYLGTIVSSQLTYYLLTSQTEFGSSEIWKIYSYAPLFIGLAVYLYWLGRKTITYIILLGFGLWILYGGSRNVFIVCCLTVVILFMSDKFKSSNMLSRITYYRNKTFFLFISILFGMYIIVFVYEKLASNGSLGEYAYEKYVKQKNNEIGLMSGRMEAIMDADLISKSPIIGYGSFAKDKTGYVKQFYIEHNIPYIVKKNIDMDSVENMLPRHSCIGGLWMWHGIGAGIFWIYILYIIFRALKSGSYLLEPKLMALSVYSMLSETWNTLFSPMAVRLTMLFLWVYLILIYKQYKQVYYNRN